jgi:enterochelin esterase-like enzyme
MNTKSQIIYSEIKSSYLKKLVHYSIYIPPEIEKTEEIRVKRLTSVPNFSSLYLLHGIEGDHTDWIIKGHIQETADLLISQEKLNRLLIIMPEGFKSFYSNTYNNSEKYEDFFIKELIPKVESSYNIIQNRHFRFIGGLSMGGFGAFKLAIKYPELFSITFSHSGAFFSEPDPAKTTVESVAEALRKIFGEPYDKKHWEKNNPFSLLNDKSHYPSKGDDKKGDYKIAFYLDCGKDDRIFHLSENMHTFLTKKGIEHIYNVFDGEHSWEYWQTHIKDSLLFLNNHIKS